MQARHTSVLLALAACRPLEFAEFPPECDPSVETCPPGSGSTTTVSATTGDGGDGIQTVTSATTSTTTTTSAGSGSDGETGPVPEAPAIRSVSLAPNPLKFAGAIDVEVVADNADGVRLEYLGAEVELEEGLEGHFHGQIAAHTGLSNGTYDATLTPLREDVAGEPETRPYTLELPAAGELFLWDTMPDHGLGHVEALRVTEAGHVVAFGTLYQNGIARCFLHRRDLEGKYTEADDIRIIFPDKECQAIDLVVDGEALYLLVSMMAGDGPRWRIGSAGWGQEPTILRTGAKDERAYALARSPSGRIEICGTAPSSSLMEDVVDGRVWPLVGAPVELDYIALGQLPHQFDETLRDCAFVGERLVAVGDVFGRHEQDKNPQPPKRTRPLLLELDGEGGPAWHVAGLGPGNATQGSISELTIDGEGRYVTGLHTCADACDPQGEMRVYEPGGKVWWQVTLGANILPPRDIVWSPAGYLVVASAEDSGNWSSTFVLQAFIPAPGQYEPAWNFSKAEMANLHLASAVAVGPGVVVGGGLGGASFPALAFLRP